MYLQSRLFSFFIGFLLVGQLDALGAIVKQDITLKSPLPMLALPVNIAAYKSYYLDDSLLKEYRAQGEALCHFFGYQEMTHDFSSQPSSEEQLDSVISVVTMSDQTKRLVFLNRNEVSGSFEKGVAFGLHSGNHDAEAEVFTRLVCAGDSRVVKSRKKHSNAKLRRLEKKTNYNK